MKTYEFLKLFFARTLGGLDTIAVAGDVAGLVLLLLIT